MKEYFKIIPAVYLVLVTDSILLMLKRKNTGYHDGEYGLVSGHLNGNESLVQAMVRETKEEAGITVLPENLKLIHVVNRQSLDSERIDFFFLAKEWAGQIENKEPHKCAELKWFPLDQLPVNTIPEVKQALENFKKNNFYSELNW
ncbi:MAG: NUDIX domain-containing protein [Candidatus Diapherotrites archaeon]|nr:NUDIX domain-containing protein [Candidatus Diapherotrites archaeon]